ncbi:MAG: hypothetical protein ISR72_06935 [Methylobacter sp.]|nr:hypothetical protein [Candidatus Brocadiales bacterium]MBL6986762.1 hypothetical protein [Methylobacter sp.]
MSLNSVKQYADVVNGIIHIHVPEGFNAKRVELTIVPLDDDTSSRSTFQQFLLDSPEMSDDEYAVIEDKIRHLRQWK